jgi:outer membrane murein-binding lipoprotein Lpp
VVDRHPHQGHDAGRDGAGWQGSDGLINAGERPGRNWPGLLTGSIDNDANCDNHMIMDDMSERMSVLEDDMSELKTDVSVLKTDVSVLKIDVSVLKTDVSVLKTDVSVLKTDVTTLKIDVAVLKGDVAVLKTDVSVLKGDVSVLKTDVAAIRTNYSTKEDIAQLEVRLVKWSIGCVVALSGVIVSAVRFIH